MKEIGAVMNVSELGVTDENIRPIAESTFIPDGEYKILNADDAEAILKARM